jgi:ABC transport system ATP-binding/permease protein
VEKAFLQIVSGCREGTNILLNPKGTLLLGRRRGDLIFDDALVSGSHCQIYCKGGSYFVKDLGSTNGTLVDGRTVFEEALTAGAEIAIGSNKMLLYFGEPEDSPTTVTVTSGVPNLDIAWLLDEELAKLRGVQQPNVDVIGQDLRLPPGLSAIVEVVAGQDSGNVFRFGRGNIAIGRRHGDIPLGDVEVSRHHAIIELFGRDMVFLRDLGSTNGTYHNGRRVTTSRLRAGDTIGCGKTVMKLGVSG